MNNSNSKKTIGSALFWKFLERFGVQGSQFVLQIILARLLSPEHYGVLSLMVIFTTLANVFIQRGFNTALIQNKDVTEEDYSSVFYVTMGIAVVIYAILYISAPWIAVFYKMPDLVKPFRVLCLVLFPGALNSIQLAKVSRAMDFKKVFRSNVIAIVFSGIVGIVLAYLGAGLWALVVQNLLNVTVAAIVMWFTVKWRPMLVCNTYRLKALFSYGWKLLVSGLIDTAYADLYSLVIGRKYNASALAYYERGKQFPKFIINAVNTTVQTVMLPAMSAEQNDKEKVKSMTRASVMLSSYIIFPMMAGLAGIATPMVRLLLTEKWLPCVPFMQICCFSMALMPIHSCNLQAINAMGRSDIFLKLEIIKKIYGILLLVFAVVFYDSVLAIALVGIVSSLVSSVVNASPNKKLIGYSYLEQVIDIFPSMILSLVMFGAVLLLGKIVLPDILLLIMQIFVGIAVYVGMSAVLGLKPFKHLFGIVKNFKKKEKQ